MLDQETDRVFKAASERTIAQRSSISMKELLASDVPYSVKMFFRTDVESLLLEEQRSLHEQSSFRYDHPEIQGLQQQMNSSLILHYTMSSQEFEKRLGDVVHLIANYLVRPQWTMRSVFFEKESILPTNVLLRMLKYFGAYEYLRDITKRYISDKSIASFTKDDFSHFLWRADGEYVRRKTGDELARVLTPLYEFFDYPKKSNHNEIPSKALSKYFEDKGLYFIAAQLEGENANETTALSQARLAELLEDARRSNGAFSPEPLEPDTDPAAAPSIEVSPAVTTAEKRTEPPSPARSEAPIPPAAQPAQPGGPKPLPLANFSQVIDEGDRKRFIRKIFQQDEHSFDTALQFMSGIASWKDASRFIDGIFIQNDIDPYSSEAKKFIDTIFQQFYPTK